MVKAVVELRLSTKRMKYKTHLNDYNVILTGIGERKHAQEDNDSDCCDE